MSSGGRDEFLLKVNDHRASDFWRRLRRSKARVELGRAIEIARRGVPTPIPVAAGELRRLGLLERCYELVPWLPRAIDLRRLLDEHGGSPARRREVATALGRLVRRMHDAGVDQDDLAPNNFLWNEADAALLAIDFERARLGTSVAAARRTRALAKLDRHCAGVSAATRMRFMRAYADRRCDETRARWREVEIEAAALFRRDVRRWTRTATRSGRRFATLSLSIGSQRWRGFMRRDAPLDAIRATLAAPAPSSTGDLLVRPVPAHAGAATLVWGVAQALHQRGASPEPIALLANGGDSRLVLRLAEPVVALCEENPRTARALIVLLDRLLSWGALRDAAGRGAFATTAAGARIWLLDPGVLALHEPAAPERRHGMARARAAALLGQMESSRS